MYSQIASNRRKTWILIVFFVSFILGLGWIFSVATEAGSAPIILAIIIATIMSLTGYYAGDKIALTTHGAKKIEEKDNPYVYRMVENLAITGGLPTPKVFLINDPHPNAFATGRNPKNASVALTTGIVERLTNEELEGVIAHELSHIKNYDIRVMTLVVVLVGIVALATDFFLRMHWYGFGNRRSRGGDGRLSAILLIIGLVLALISPLIAELIKLAVSRRREFLADASGVLLTRYPEGLANALRKISAYPNDLMRANHATAHLFLVSPFKGTGKFLNKLFMTHPPIEERIAALENMGKNPV